MANGKIIKIGDVFGRLTVIKRIPANGTKKCFLICRCSCGKDRKVGSSWLRNKNTLSCGCLRKELRTTHGKSNSKIYRVWNSMLQRTENPKTIGYKNYGGRGITVCSKWHDFSEFYKDMGDCPKKELTLERINNNCNYEPANCKWATRYEQVHNRRPRRS